MPNKKTILLVEDNKDDEILALRAMRKNNIANNIIIARDGEEALEYIFNTGKHADAQTQRAGSSQKHSRE